MATIIRRSSAQGNPSLPRIPFEEPGAKPLARLSVLASQNIGTGARHTDSVPDAETSNGRFVPAELAPRYSLRSDGVPIFDFDSSLSNATTPAMPGISYDGTIDVPPRTLIVVARIVRPPSGWPSSNQHRRAYLIRGNYSGNNSIFVRSTDDPNNPGTIGALGSSNTENQLVGPLAPVDGNLHFFACVFNADESALYVDSSVTKGTMNEPSGTAGLIAGLSMNGSRFHIIEAASYAEALTDAQIAEKRVHLRSLFSF